MKIILTQGQTERAIEDFIRKIIPEIKEENINCEVNIMVAQLEKNTNMAISYEAEIETDSNIFGDAN